MVMYFRRYISPIQKGFGVGFGENLFLKKREFDEILGENFFGKKFSPNPFQKTSN